MESTDLALMTRIRQRDSAALSELYDRYSTRVYSLCMAILRNEHAAQEATQDVFIKIWTHPERYQFDDNRFCAWLLMIARHRSIDQLRRDKHRLNDQISIDDEHFPELRDADGEQQARWRDMQHVLSSLPPEQRAVIVLAYYHGLSQSEIAAHLNSPLGTVKTRLRLAMEKLRVVVVRD